MEYNNVLLDVVLWVAVIGGFFTWAIRRELTRDVRQVPEPMSHVRRLAGVRRRCVGCKKIKSTMDMAEGWSGPPLPYCAGCLRDTLGLDDSEAVA